MAVIDATTFVTYNPTNDNTFYPSLVFDAFAKNGIVMNLPAKSGDWLVRFEPREEFNQIQNSKEVTLRVKVDVPMTDGYGFIFGCYNTKEKKYVLEEYVLNSKLKEKFTDIKFKFGPINKDCIFFVSAIPIGNKRNILIDNFTFR